MGFQSSFNQALGTLAGAALGYKHIKGQKESIAEQKMQGKFNVEREVNREQEQNEVAEPNANEPTTSNANEPTVNKNNEVVSLAMAARAGQALANETYSKNYTYHMTTLPNHQEWVKQYMDWYGVNRNQAKKAYYHENNLIQPINKKEEEGGKE